MQSTLRTAILLGLIGLPTSGILSMMVQSSSTSAAGPIARSTSRPALLGAAWGDLGDGTYANPILPGDYSDIDAIRVGDDFYAISSTFHYSPGIVILHSRDLVNWTILGHAIQDITQIGPELNWNVMDRYGRGVWAGAIRHHAGRFWIYFGTPDEGFFMTSAKNPAGPWDPLTHVLKAKGWDDCCPFWDDTDGKPGKGYLICTNFADGYKIHLFELTPDGKAILPDSDRVLYSSKGSEANKLFKINGTYYHFFSEVHAGGRREIMMRRAKSLDGPWEMRQLNRVDKAIDREPNQGGLIELQNGQWSFLTHQGSAAWEGRTMALLPVTWIDGWPIPGTVASDGIGTMTWQAPKPINGFPTTRPQTDDDFDAPTLKPQWEWNYQPRNEMWSLTQRPSFLRLHSFKPLNAHDLSKVGNMLTQRSNKTASNEVTARFDLSGMKDGDHAGLAHFARAFATITVSHTGNTRRLRYTEKGRADDGPVLSKPDLWLRSKWDDKGISQFSYSLDGKHFTDFGPKYTLVWQSYRGDRTGLFHYNTHGDGGYVDIDSYRMEMTGPGR